MITKKQIVDFIAASSSFESISEMSQDAPNSYPVRFAGSGAKLEFDGEFSKWSYAKIKGDDRFLVYAKVGVVHHKKFNRELGFIFILDDENKIEHICGYLAQNIRNRLTLIQMLD